MSQELLPLHRYRNVIMDVDGTLMLSNDAHAHAFIEAFQANGIHHIQFNDIRKLMGMNGKSILRHMLDEKTFQTKGDKIEQDRIQIFRDRYLSTTQPAPGVLPLLELLHAHGIRVALSSSSPKAIVDQLIQKLGITHLIEGSTSNEDTPMGKPNPVAIEACCQKFGFAPEHTLMIGDSPYDVISAHEFSIPTIGVLTGGYSQDELQKTGALVVYNDLKELYQRFQQTVLNK